MKIRHRHVIEATVVLTEIFDPTDLEGAAKIQKNLVAAAEAMVGFRKVSTRMTKEPILAADAPVNAAADSHEVKAADDVGVRPAFMDAKKVGPLRTQS